MRVVAGSLGGRRLSTPPGRSTRPTSELVRAAIFNSLEAHGLLDATTTVADLFAGSGALGIEALSRGAAHVHFVDSDPAAVRTIRANLAALDLSADASVHHQTVERWSMPPVGLVLADPPYDWDGWEDLLTTLATFSVVTVVAESDREVRSEGWRVLGVRRHGGTVVSQLQPRGAIQT